MTPQEKALLQHNASLSPDISSVGVQPMGQPSTPPSTLAEGLSAMKSKIDTRAQTEAPDFSALAKKYNVKDMIPSSLKNIMGSKTVTPAPTQVPRTPIFAPQQSQRTAQQASDAITGAMGTLSTQFAPLKDLQGRLDYQSVMDPERAVVSGLEAYKRTSGGSDTPMGVAQIRRSGIPGSDILAGGLEATGKSMVEGTKGAVEGVQNIGTGFQKIASGDMSGFDDVFRKGLFQGITSGAGVVYSPLIGAMSQLPEPVKQGLGAVVGQVENGVNTALSSVGVDPNDVLGQNIKAGMLALLDVAPFLGSSKTVRGAVKGAGQNIAKTAKGILNAPQTARILEGVNVMGKSSAQMFNNAVKKAIATAKKATGKTTDFALDAASNSAFMTPAKHMKNAAKYGDEFVKVIDDVPTSELSILDDIGQSVDNVLSEKGTIGAMYNPLRQSNQRVLFKKNWDAGVFDDLGLQIKNGSVVPKFGQMKNSKLSTQQLQQLNNRIGELLPKAGEKFTVDQLLKLKDKLDDIADWTSSANRADKPVMAAARDLYGRIDDIAKKDIRGLAGIDAKYSKLAREFKALKKEFMAEDAYGNLSLKPNIQPETITRLLSPTNRNKLKMLEQYIPDITKRLEILDSAKAILAAGEITTGRGLGRIVTSGIATSVNPLYGLATFFLSDPVRASKFFAKYGKNLGMATDTLDSARRAAQSAASQAKKTAEGAVKSVTNLNRTKAAAAMKKSGTKAKQTTKATADVGATAASGVTTDPTAGFDPTAGL